ncbi:hypothetical protein OG342_07065 [Streptomyces bobili]|uniref:hypothetical protein n=1 Tax=Streptomyces bobili TaxID=67280 RepID=UPI0022507ABB|nr:hypothetical protein [Streptomyces bobili]MCX5522624.1 hypothetical protein [Streptomyces bobili]
MTRECWVAEELPGLGCDPTWTADPQPTDAPPTPWDIRQAEISDLRHQGAALIGIYRATTIHAPEYL